MKNMETGDLIFMIVIIVGSILLMVFGAYRPETPPTEIERLLRILTVK